MADKGKILFWGYEDSRLIDFLEENGNEVVVRTNKLKLSEIDEIRPKEIVSYGYRHIIKPDVIEKYPEIINLHISYLPWNRGGFPNFWSWLENTPKGFTIHYIDEGIDTGDILIQQRAENFFNSEETLVTSYEKLRAGIEDLFIENWGEIVSGRIPRITQDKDKGNLHYVRDLESYRFLMKGGWDTPVREIREYGKRNGLWLFG